MDYQEVGPENQYPEDWDTILAAWLRRYEVFDFKDFKEIPLKGSGGTDMFDEPEGNIDDLDPIPSLEELIQAAAQLANKASLHQRLVESVFSRMMKAFYILVGASMGDLLWTGDIRPLLAILVFFLVLFLRLVNGHRNG